MAAVTAAPALGAFPYNRSDGERDVVRCGKGVDRVSADAADGLVGCERRLGGKR